MQKWLTITDGCSPSGSSTGCSPSWILHPEQRSQEHEDMFGPLVQRWHLDRRSTVLAFLDSGCLSISLFPALVLQPSHCSAGDW